MCFSLFMQNLRQISIFNNKELKRDLMEQTIILSLIIELNEETIFNTNNFK